MRLDGQAGEKLIDAGVGKRVAEERVSRPSRLAGRGEYQLRTKFPVALARFEHPAASFSVALHRSAFS